MKATQITVPNMEVQGKIQIVPGFYIEWLQNGQILVETFENGSRDVADAFHAVATQVIDNWTTKRPVLLLNDFSAPQFAMTPYLRKQIETVVKHSQDMGLHGRVSLIMVNRLATQMMQLFIRASNIVISNKGLETRIFTSRENALKWLEELIASA